MLKNVNDMLSFFRQTESFVATVQYTAARFKFMDRLVEKDYLCSLVLKYLYMTQNHNLIFKGGTLLSKVHANFNRLSEELDFMIPVPANATRNQRSKSIHSAKKILHDINYLLPIFTVKKELAGHNNSCQYTMELNYKSNLTGLTEKILIDIGLRDTLLMPEQFLEARTILMDPFNNDDSVELIQIIGLHLQEAYAEKIRAALCRKELAIRDYYDLDYCTENNLVALSDEKFLLLVKEKVRNEKHFHDPLDQKTYQTLYNKIKTELEPTLKTSSLDNFSLTRICNQLDTLKKDLTKF